MPKKDFDLVVLTIGRDVPLVALGIHYMRRFFSPRKTVFVAPGSCLESLRRMGIPIEGDETINEDEISTGLSVGLIRGILKERGANPDRAGWYFKQIAIFAYAMRADSAERYLVWDADTIPLREMSFFDGEGKPSSTRKVEHLLPYFATLRSFLGDRETGGFLFIAEHMMFDTDIVRSLVGDAMKGESYSGEAFGRRVMCSIADENLAWAGFSEYETYGNYATARFPDRIAVRDLPSLRRGFSFMRSPGSRRP